MKNNKIIIPLAVVLLLIIAGFMAYDFFGGFNKSEENPYEYKLEAYLQVDTNQISHVEIQQISVDIEMLRAVALDAEDNIYVSGKNKLLMYNPQGHVLHEIPIEMEAFCMTISEEAKIYLGTRKMIWVYNLQGKLLDSWDIHDETCILTSLAVHEQNLFLADAANKLVYRYNLTGEFLHEIGRKDESLGIEGFIIPSPYFDLAVGRDGELWAVNSGRHQLESYNSDGRLISSWKKSSMGLDGFSGCCNPSHVALLSNGDFVTSEKGIERIKISSPSGEFLSVVAPPDSFHKGTRGIDLAVDSKDRIITIDPDQNLIRIFIHKEK